VSSHGINAGNPRRPFRPTEGTCHRIGRRALRLHPIRRMKSQRVADVDARVSRLEYRNPDGTAIVVTDGDGTRAVAPRPCEARGQDQGSGTAGRRCSGVTHGWPPKLLLREPYSNVPPASRAPACARRTRAMPRRMDSSTFTRAFARSVAMSGSCVARASGSPHPRGAAATGQPGSSARCARSVERMFAPGARRVRQARS
jgi:hypothetical protein